MSEKKLWDIKEDIIMRLFLDNIYSVEDKLAKDTLLKAVEEEKGHQYWMNYEDVEKLLKAYGEAVLDEELEKLMKLEKELHHGINCPQIYPDCGSPHACDMCYENDELKAENKALREEIEQMRR